MLNWFRQLWRDVQVGGKRSSNWSKVRKEHLIKEPVCQVCGRDKGLSVHHLRPFHLYPELEEEPTNLITLCESKGMNCHYVFGHCFLSWSCYNDNIRNDITFITRLRENAKFKKKE